MEIEEAFELASRDFKAWEIVSEGSHVIADIRRKLEELIPSYDLELSLHAPFSDVNIGSFNRRMREESIRQVIEAIRIAKDVGMNPVTLHPGHLSPISFSNPKKTLEITKKSIKEIDSTVQDLGMTVGVENMPDMIITICKKAQDLVYAVEGTDIGICFDVGHANTTGETDNFLQIKDKFVNVHIHDNNGSSDQHLLLGEGTVDFKKVLKNLSTYSGNFVLETRKIEDAVVGKRHLEKLLAK